MKSLKTEFSPIEAMQWMKFLCPNYEDRIRSGDDHKEVLLGTLLKHAVPLQIEKLKGLSYRHICKRKNEISKLIAAKGDNLLYGSKRKGEASDLFVQFSEGVAILALIAKGGVTMFGEHFDYPFPEYWEAEYQIYKHEINSDKYERDSKTIEDIFNEKEMQKKKKSRKKKSIII